MKTVIIYSQNTPSPDHRAMSIIKGNVGASLFFRFEIVEADILKALEMAKPRDGETVLNSVEVP